MTERVRDTQTLIKLDSLFESVATITCFSVGSPSLAALIGLQGNHREHVPQKRQPSVYGWEVIGQSCGNAREPDWWKARDTLSSLPDFHLLRFTGYWSQHHPHWWRLKPVLLSFQPFMLSLSITTIAHTQPGGWYSSHTSYLFISSPNFQRLWCNTWD